MIRFLIDAQLPPGFSRKLTDHAFRAEHVTQIGLGSANDATIWSYARKVGATLITKDHDFVLLATAEPSGPAVVWIRIGNIAHEPLWRAIEPRLEEIVQALAEGERVVELL